jgi:hypothetical protein
VRKGNGGDVGVLSPSRNTEGEERRGWWESGAGGATWRKEERRPGLRHSMRRRTMWGVLAGSGADRGARSTGVSGSRPSVAARARVGDEGGSGQGGCCWAVAMGRPKRTMSFCN